MRTHLALCGRAPLFHAVGRTQYGIPSNSYSTSFLPPCLYLLCYAQFQKCVHQCFPLPFNNYAKEHSMLCSSDSVRSSNFHVLKLVLYLCVSDKHMDCLNCEMRIVELRKQRNVQALKH
ncbi:MAG: hypothetical protein EZS28_041921 [Streblomastix strix]|uniref:Uncharacterized protein n=1 Tax=Streblomastix strix TaxID=222440 RepID=A0A5J4TXJ0_9EUKA|nr:MAG: hypothetical protein EZS28_041921 [Streblomastix strix]